MAIRIILTIVIFVFYSTGVSQNNHNRLPASYKLKLKSTVPVIEIFDTKLILPENDSKIPLQAGYTIPVYEVARSGKWDYESGVNIWRAEFHIDGVAALNIYFKKLKLSEKQELFIYNADYQNVIRINNNESGTICTDFVEGDRVIVELNTVNHSKELPFTMDEIGVLINGNTRGFGDAGDCEVYINCIEGENWQQQKNGVARILVKEGSHTFWCTGSLINNTNNDGTPLFLTANHCGEDADSTDYSEWLFYFNYESEYCGEPVLEPELNTITGSYFLAKSDHGTTLSSDFKLLRLSQYIPKSFKPYYNGWDRETNASLNGVGIHHPQGDLKMISTYTEPLLSTDYDELNENPSGKYWRVYWAETQNGHGVTEGGSSGSPIFNSNGYMVGALTGGRASCSNKNQPDYYGKLSHSWDAGQDSTESLSHWLDPMGTGVTRLKGTNLDSTNIYAGFSGEPLSILVGESVTFLNTSFGNIESYSWYFEGGNPEYSEQEEPGEITYNEAGEFDVRLIVRAGETTDTLLVKDYISVLPNISPNPGNGTIKLTFGGNVPEEYDIRVFTASGQETGYTISETGENYIIIELMPNINGASLISFVSDEISNTYKVIVIGN